MRYLVITSLAALLITGCVASAAEKAKAITETARQGKLEEARSRLEELAASNPDCAQVHYELGGVYQSLGDNGRATAEYKATLAADPAYYDACYDIWDIEINTAKDEDAKKQIKARIKQELDNLVASNMPSDKLYALGFFVYDMVGEPDRCEAMKQSLITKYPDSEQLKGKGQVGQTAFEHILRVSSERAKRVPLCEAYVRDFPNHKMADVAYRIILTYYWQDKPLNGNPDTDKIREFTQMWAKSKPEHPLALHISARVYAELGIDLDQAARWAGDAVRHLQKNSPSTAEWSISDKKPFWYYEWQYNDEVRIFEALDTLGWVYFKQGDLARAEQYLNQALLYENFHSRIWYHLGKVYEAQGKTDAAIDSYARSLMSRSDITDVTPAFKELIKSKYPLFGENPDELYELFYQAMAQRKDEVYFADATDRAGLDAASGRRVAWGDYDNDGFQDLLISGSYLWRNKGDGQFEDVTKQAKLSGGYGGGIWADYDNDGFLDFFASGGKDALWQNNGDGTFTNVTNEVNPKLSNGYPTEGAGWGDYDRDGFVDLYLANYEQPFGVGTPDFLYKNEQGRIFRDVSNQAGITPPKNLCGRGVNWGDYNDDGFLDIFVSNYRLNPDFLWRNKGDGTFANVAREVGVEGTPAQGYYGHTIGSEWADFDNDGDLDLFQANLAHPRYIEFSNMSYLLKNEGAPDYRFTEHRRSAGIRFEETHSEPAWADYDNDGLLDLYITSVYPTPPSFLYRQTDNGRFQDVTWLSGTRVLDGWGCAWADYDNDGDPDLVVAGKSRGEGKGNIYLFRNEVNKRVKYFRIEYDGNVRREEEIEGTLTAPNHNWLKVRLVGADCNRSAIGARLILKMDNGQMMREVEGGKGTTNQNSLVQHFGLGRYTGPLELTVRWPCGRLTRHRLLPNNNATITESIK